METLVILVDAHDNETGLMEKLRAHQEGALHRAVSVVLFRSDGGVLLQRRSAAKYHSAGLWSNTACTHPRPAEAALDAARRCLREEMGIGDVQLRPAGTILYRARVSESLEEHELDHVFVGESGDTPTPDPGEVSEWGWRPAATVFREAEAEPGRFSAWLPAVLRLALAESAAPASVRRESGGMEDPPEGSSSPPPATR